MELNHHYAHQCQLRFPGQGRSQGQLPPMGWGAALSKDEALRLVPRKMLGWAWFLQEEGRVASGLVFNLKLGRLSAAKRQCREGKAWKKGWV